MKNIKKALILLLASSMLFCAIPVFANEYKHEDHTDLAFEAVSEGIVMLKNQGNALPLAKKDKIALFGGGQIYTASTTSGYQIGGGGSGWVSSMQGTPKSPADALIDAQTAGKISVYEPLLQEYKNNVGYVPTEDMYNSASEFANTAVMFITRYSTEGSDINKNDWYLSDAEKNMMKTLSEKFDKLIVILNTPSVIGTEWSLDGNTLGVDVDALLACYMGGEKGGVGMANILLGDVNPSGKLTHTYAKDLYDYPTTNTFLESSDYVKYSEDIYVGYRYFETFENAKNKVAYPFGHGLSYTTFDIKANSVSVKSGNITVKVTVKNTGTVAGKEVVQLYYSAPQAGTGSAKLSKSAISLAEYAKTKLLAPNESETVTLSFPIANMASFDDTGKTGKANCYVLEAGDYDILIGNSSRNLKLADTYTVNSLTVVSQHDRLVDTNLDKRLNYDGSYENLPVKTVEDIKSNVYSNKLNWIEAESGTPSSGSSIKKNENYGTGGYLYNGTQWQSIEAGIVLGNMNGNQTGHTVKYKLHVENAGTYKIGFIIANGSDRTDAEGNLLTVDNMLDIYVSTDNTLGTKQPVSIDIENTNQAGTGGKWFNFKYCSSDFEDREYTVALPKGDCVLTLSIAANTLATPNIDKFVIIPDGKSCTVENVVSHYNGTDIASDIDIYKDNYKGIKYADVAAGKATMEELIAQMSYSELINLCYGHMNGLTLGVGTIGFAYNKTSEKYGIYSADTADGPAGLRLDPKVSTATFWPCSTLQASTWNRELVERIGQAVGEECLRHNADIWLAPGLNIHRNPLCGRNFEYYSEDPVVSGKTAAAVIKGVQSKGIACAAKHFAMNNKEGNRKNSDSRVSEKAMREIYLKGFEIAVKEAEPMCIMTSYNLVNGSHASANSELIKGILRKEWNFKGLIMSDWTTTPFITNEILSGNNVTMPNGEPKELENSIKKGILTRKDLEENAAYIINTLVKLPDHTVHMNCVNKLSTEHVTKITADKYNIKAYTTRFEIIGGEFCSTHNEVLDEADGAHGFLEFKIDAERGGIYALSLDYASIYDIPNAFSITINGDPIVDANQNVDSTGSWTTLASKKVANITLDEGISTIRIQHLSSSGTNYAAISLLPLKLFEHNHVFKDWTELDGSQHKRICSCGKEEIEDHKWDDGAVTVEPTYDAEGTKTYTCSECGATKTEVIPMMEQEQSETSAPLPKDEPLDKDLIVIISICAVAIPVVAGAIVGIVFLIKKKKNI